MKDLRETGSSLLPGVLVLLLTSAVPALGQVPNLVTVRSGPLLQPVNPLPPAPDDITFYDPATGAQIAQFSALSNNPSSNNSVVFTPDRTRVIVSGGAQTNSVQVFDVTGALPVQIATRGFSNPPADLDVTPNGRFVIVRNGLAQNPFVPPPVPPDSVVFLNPVTGTVVAMFPAASNGATTRGPNMISITPDSTRALVTGGVGADAIQVFDLTPAVPVLIATHSLTRSPYDVDVSPDGKVAVVRSGPPPVPVPGPPPAADNITFLNPATGALVTQLGSPSDNPRSSNAISFTPDSARAVVTSGPGQGAIRVFDLTTASPTLLSSLFLSQAPGDVEVTPDARLFVVRSGLPAPAPGPAVPDAVAFVNPVTGALVVARPAVSNNANHSSNSIAFSPDSTRAVVTGGSGADAVQIYDLTVPVPVLLASFTLSTPADDVHVTPNAKLAIVRSGTPPFPPPGGAVFDAIAFYDPAAATTIALFPAATSNPWDANSIAVLPDSSRAVVTGGGGPGTVKIFDLTPPVPVLLANHFVTNPVHDVQDAASPQDLHQPDMEAIEVDHFPETSAGVQMTGPFGPEIVRLKGPSTVLVSIGPNGEALDSDGDGLDEVRTQMVQLSPSGTSPMLGSVALEIRSPAEPPFQPTLGVIEETVNTQPGRLDVPPFAPSGSATSFFEVFFQAHVSGPLGQFLLHNEDEKHMEETIEHKPPAKGEGYGDLEHTPLFDENRNAAGIRADQVVHVPDCDGPPVCEVVILPNVGADATITAGNGLFSIVVTKKENAMVNVPGFPLGSKGPVLVTARKEMPGVRSVVELTITDICGTVITCDPVFTLQIRDPGKPVSETVSGLPQAEGKVTVVNGSPGVTTLRVDVNGKSFLLTSLADGEQRTLDVSSAMLPGNGNVIVLTAQGKPGGSAEVVIHD
ncbi:MAG TPA: hypothetical protein VE685_15155 [Thermoanaerobaculia bacterium]|nr:hypothetical protein [Thermoanaerobaculia bacterium]